MSSNLYIILTQHPLLSSCTSKPPTPSWTFLKVVLINKKDLYHLQHAYKIPGKTGHARVTGHKSSVTIRLDTRYTIVVMIRSLIKLLK